MQTLCIDPDRRWQVVRELRRLQAENDSLVGRHSALAEEMAAETINLPDSLEEMQLLLLRYREDLIAAKLGRERAEERGRAELGAARERLAGAERARAGLERQHRAELQDLQTKVTLTSINRHVKNYCFPTLFLASL